MGIDPRAHGYMSDVIAIKIASWACHDHELRRLLTEANAYSHSGNTDKATELLAKYERLKTSGPDGHATPREPMENDISMDSQAHAEAAALARGQ